MRSLVVAALLCLSCIAPAAAADLYRREVAEKNPGGKDLVMAFEELRRDEKTSLAKLTYKSGASVPSSMFIARSFYDIARARGAEYFIKLRELRAQDGSTMFLVGFSNSTAISPREYFGLAEAPPDSGERAFMSVREFAGMFEAPR